MKGLKAIKKSNVKPMVSQNDFFMLSGVDFVDAAKLDFACREKGILLVDPTSRPESRRMQAGDRYNAALDIRLS
jgi:hypothetical protein